MKKLLTILITILMLFVLVGCDGNESASGSNSSGSTSGSLFGGTEMKRVDYSETGYEYADEDDEYYEFELSNTVEKARSTKYYIEYVNTTSKTLDGLLVKINVLDENSEIINTQTKVLNADRVEAGQTGAALIDIVKPYGKEVTIEVGKFYAEIDREQSKMVGNITYTFEVTPKESEPEFAETIKLTATNNNKEKADVSFRIFSFIDGIAQDDISSHSTEINPGETVEIRMFDSPFMIGDEYKIMLNADKY